MAKRDDAEDYLPGDAAAAAAAVGGGGAGGGGDEDVDAAGGGEPSSGGGSGSALPVLTAPPPPDPTADGRKLPHPPHLVVVPETVALAREGRYAARLGGGGPPVVREAVERLGWVSLDADDDLSAATADGPREWYLFWRSGRFKPSDYTTIRPFQRMNHHPKTSIITKKDTLHKHLTKFASIHGTVYNFFPEGYLLPVEYTKFVKAYAAQSEAEKCIWICKPIDLSRGRKIFLIRDISELVFDHPSIIQRYISNPLTVGGYKMDLRLYILVSTIHPLRIYLYQEGMVRFGTEKYDADAAELSNLFAHLTNASINKLSDTYTAEKDVIGGGCKWLLSRLAKYLERERPGLDFSVVWGHIQTLVTCTILMLPPVAPHNPSCFEVYGFDVMLDKNFKPWLIEVNCSPAMGLEEEVDRIIKPAMITDSLYVIQKEAYDRRQAALDAEAARRAQLKPRGTKAGAKPSAAAKSAPAAATGVSAARSSSAPRANTASKLSGTAGSARAAGVAARAPAPAAALAAAAATGLVPEETAGPLVDLPGPFNGTHPGSLGNYELIFPFSPETFTLADQLVSVAADPAKVQVVMKEIMSHVRARDRSFDKK